MLIQTRRFPTPWQGRGRSHPTSRYGARSSLGRSSLARSGSLEGWIDVYLSRDDDSVLVELQEVQGGELTVEPPPPDDLLSSKSCAEPVYLVAERASLSSTHLDATIER